MIPLASPKIAETNKYPDKFLHNIFMPMVYVSHFMTQQSH
jgi:hypothetical protein